MKKLSIEEKAKAYDERLEKAQKWYDINTNKGYRSIFKDIFPELKESEDEKIRREIKQFIRSRSMHIVQSKVESWLYWLEKQGEQKAKYHDVCDKCVRQPTCQSNCFLQQDEHKNDWSEEDEKILDRVITNYESGYLPSVEKRDEIIEKLKSLKDRVQPQPKWKPSDKQMADLWNMLCEYRPADHQLLQDIYNDLKKLREE